MSTALPRFLTAVNRYPRRSLLSYSSVSLMVLAGALAAGCARMPEAMPGLERNLAFTPNDFDNAATHTRHIAASQERTCEAARRTLLSQGYLVHTATSELVAGRKYYQPHTDVHYEVEMRVVCAPEGPGDSQTSAFASALQDRYVIKKINNSASLGVGALGSVSLPVTASDDTLVKVGSETVTDPQFYERFFQIFERYVSVLSERRSVSNDTVPLQEREAVEPGTALPQE